MKRLFTLAILAATLTIPATTQAGAPSTTSDAKTSIGIHYGSLVRESAYVNARFTATCHYTQKRNFYTCRTNLYAGIPRRLRVRSDWLIWCAGGPFCTVEKRLLTWRYE